MIGDQTDYQVAQEWQKNKDAMNDIKLQIAQLKQQYQELEYACKQSVRYFRNRMHSIDIIEVNTVTHTYNSKDRVQYVITNNNNKINMRMTELF